MPLLLLWYYYPNLCTLGRPVLLPHDFPSYHGSSPLRAMHFLKKYPVLLYNYEWPHQHFVTLQYNPHAGICTELIHIANNFYTTLVEWMTVVLIPFTSATSSKLPYGRSATMRRASTIPTPGID